MSMYNANARLRANEQGFAAIVIAFVLILVLSLVTVGFAQLMRREQQSALDRQLNSQAYYAAESGINDAAKAINSGYTGTKSTCPKLTASEIAATPSIGGTTEKSGKYLSNNEVSKDSTGSSYTCLTIDPTPQDLQYSSVPTEESIVTQITGVSPSDNSEQPIASLEISWEDSGSGHDFFPYVSGDYKFQTSDDWTYTGVLRIGITPLASGSISRAQLSNKTYTAFLYPNDADTIGTAVPGTDSYNSGNDINGGNIIRGNCKTGNLPRHCRVKITNLSEINDLLTIRSVYKNTAVTIKALDGSGNQLSILNAQTVVDSTGKAQDVLKRLQVRIPSKNSYDHTDYGLRVMDDICKQLQLRPAAAGSNKAECQP